jgi:hypothetical protein
MAKPKNMTPEQEAAWNKEQNAKKRLWREANKEKCLDREKAYREANRQKIRQRSNKWAKDNYKKLVDWRTNNVEKVKQYKDKWKKENPEKLNEVQKLYTMKSREKLNAKTNEWRKKNKYKVQETNKLQNRKNVDNLTDKYVTHCLRIKVAEVPPQLLEFKREQLAMSRLVRQLNQVIDETNQEQNHE